PCSRTLRSCFFVLSRHSPTSTLFPYTTLFRSLRARRLAASAAGQQRPDFLRPARRCRAPGRVFCVFSRLQGEPLLRLVPRGKRLDRKSTRLNSSHGSISYAVFCLKKKINTAST